MSAKTKGKAKSTDGTSYELFLKGKEKSVPVRGITGVDIHPALFDFQRHVAGFLLERGTAAAFLDTGLGKTITQLEWARHVSGEVLIVAPLAVAQQTVKEAESLLNLAVNYSKDGTISERVTITNYERLDRFDLSRFKGVVLDESSILKGFNGKTKRALCDGFDQTPFRLACTATPAPNDHMELGNHAEFLGVMGMQEMLMRWFIHDSANTAEWRLKGHAAGDFWRWVGSWAACVSMPSDLGYSDEGYILPALTTRTEVVRTPLQSGGLDELFALPSTSATDMHATKRLTLRERCGLAAELVNGHNEAALVWCESNDESEMLRKMIPDAVEVRGSDTMDAKEDRMNAFSDGRARVLVTKPSICGFGMNWQHAHRMVFASISYSYEAFYQAIRREWRFGQKSPVTVDVVISDAELPIWRAVERKAAQHDEMKRAMVKNIMGGNRGEKKESFQPTKSAVLPSWMGVA